MADSGAKNEFLFRHNFYKEDKSFPLTTTFLCLPFSISKLWALIRNLAKDEICVFGKSFMSKYISRS